MAERLTLEFELVDREAAKWIWEACKTECKEGIHGVRPRILSWEPVFKERDILEDILGLLLESDYRLQERLEELLDDPDVEEKTKEYIRDHYVRNT